jgi:hypothetical protein
MAGRRVYVLGALTFGLLSSVWGASPAIGTASANGKFAVNKSQVSGSATLFDGALVETGAASSRLELSNGSRITLNANSSLTLRGKETILEKGSGEIGLAAGHHVQARTLRIEGEAANAKAEVRLSGEREVLVKALNSPVRVFSKTGVLVATVDAGMGASFDPYAAPPEAFDMTGCLLRTTAAPTRFGFVGPNNVRYELTGGNLAQHVGNRVRIVGNSATGTPFPGATAVVQVTTVALSDTGGCLAAASTWPGMTAGAPPTVVQTGTGMKGSTKAIIAGVAIGGGAGVIVGVTSGGDKSK